MALRRHPAALAVLAALVCAAALLLPAQALAHATLQASDPQRGAVLGSTPGAVTLTFDEPVEGSFGAVRVFGSGGEPVDSGEVTHPGGAGEKIAVGLEPGLADGSYTATYRLLSADGHVITGGYVFSIGEAGAPPGRTVAELISDSESGTGTDIGLGIARGVTYAATAALIGSLAFLLCVWVPAVRRGRQGISGWQEAAGAFDSRQRKLLLAASLLGLGATLAGIVFHAALAAGISPLDALSRNIVQEELGTRFGTVWGLSAIAWAAAAALVATAPPKRWVLAALALPAALLVAAPALSGHPSQQSPVVLLFPANVLHVVAMSLWLGGLLALIVCVPAATARLERPERTKLLASLLPGFSALALSAVTVLLLSGLGQAYAYVRTLDNLVDTGYGRAVAIKTALLVVLIGIGAFNRRRTIPGIERLAGAGEATGGPGLSLRRAVRTEVALIAAALGVTAALASYSPSVTEQGGPFSGSSSLGPAQLEMTVDPALAGANQVHIYLFDSTDGAQYTATKELTVTATEPERGIGPLDLEARPSGPGHYTITAAALGASGDWTFDIAARVSRFDEYRTELEVPIG